MIEPIQPDLISRALGVYGPIENVTANWPLIEAALENQGIDIIPCRIAAIATVAVETGTFAPVKERGGPAYFTKLYEGRVDLGNTERGDGVLFRGRGYIQITGRANYRNYGHAIGVDLAANPDLALDPAIAAHVLALYFRQRNIFRLAELAKWESVRRRVNGGLNNWARFLEYVTALSIALNTVPVSLASVETAEAVKT
jgi:predicted chitinase